MPSMYGIRLLAICGLFLVAAAAKKNRREDDRCRYCHFLVATFEAVSLFCLCYSIYG